MNSLSRFAAGLAVAWLVGTAAPAAAGPPVHPATAAAAGEVLLLDFSAAWCGPCRQMAPLLEQISSAGWLVRHVDVDRETDLVRRFAVTGVPCYVLLVKGHEVGRIDGATTQAELERLLAKSAAPLGGRGVAPPETPVVAAAGIPLPSTAAPAPLVTEAVPAAFSGPARPIDPPTAPLQPSTDRRAPAEPSAASSLALAPSPAAPGRDALERKLLAATARLKVEDSAGVAWGTGTVIDCRQGEALILTCGHIFRDSAGKGRVEVDLFAANGPRGVAGQVVSWDLKRDLALVSIFTEMQIDAVQVGSAERTTKPGEPVVTVGCNGGADPTLHHSRITAVDKYLGPANVQVAGQPVQGRSGGGLFAIDGTLIGVCNAADPADNEGLFAALPSIHEQLEEAGLAFVYRNVYPSGGLTDLASAGGSAHVPAMPSEMPDVSFDRRDRADALPTASTGGPVPPSAAVPAGAVATLPAGGPLEHPAVPARGIDPPAAAAPSGRNVTASADPPPLTPGEQALLDHVRQHEGRAEVICIVRPHGAAGDSSEVFVLNGAGSDFVDHLSRAHHAAAAPGGGPRSDVALLPPANPVR
jgi:thiol-disulfide isomerase/thioredoxin